MEVIPGEGGLGNKTMVVGGQRGHQKQLLGSGVGEREAGSQAGPRPQVHTLLRSVENSAPLVQNTTQQE